MKDAFLVATFAAIVIAVGAWFYTHGSVGAPSQTTSSDATTITPVSFTILSSGEMGSVTQRKNYRVSTEDGMRQLWKVMGSTEPMPVIDFTQKEVIAVFAGNKPSAGYSIAVSKIEDGAKRMVTVTLSKPGGSCVLAQHVTTPYQIVVVPRSDLLMAHVDDLQVTASCLQ